MVTLTQCHTLRFEVFSGSCFFPRKELRGSYSQATVSHCRRQGIEQGSQSPENKRVEDPEYVPGLNARLCWQDPEHLFETISQAMLNAVDRDAVSGMGVIVHIM